MASQARRGTVRWTLIRHAPVINPGGGIYGRMDLDCDVSDGPALAWLARQVPEDAVWLVTPLSRTARTAAAVRANGHASAADPVVEPALIEQDFGDWQGRGYDAVARDFPEHDRRFWLAPAEEAPPGGESFATLCARVAPALDAWSDRVGGGEIVAVCHGGTIRAAVAHALGLAPAAALKIAVDTLSVTVLLRFKGGEWAVQTVNGRPDSG